MPGLLISCRQGFEKECSAEAWDWASRHQIAGQVLSPGTQGWLHFECAEETPLSPAALRDLADWVFARQLLWALHQCPELPREDRLTPLLALAPKGRYGQLVLETADTEAHKPLLKLCRQLQKPLQLRLEKAGFVFKPQKAERDLHLFFTATDCAWWAQSLPGLRPRWYRNIPRLRFPDDAPSRSTLKLEEAWHYFLGENWRDALKPGQTAVDLGAAPGGWTWQLVQRGVKVYAVDNGPMDEKLMASGLVKHYRTDGFTFEPPHPVDWLVCDIVDKPARVISRMRWWLERGLCRRLVFNLKLPMKQRFGAIQQARKELEPLLPEGYRLRMHQLYHDREEITAYIAPAQG